MKKLLHATYLLVLAWCLSLAGVQQARASHAQGGQLTYEALGNNSYRITCRFFRDCSGIAAPTSLTLSYKNAGCTGSANTVSMPRVGPLTPGSPYCANVPGGPSQCTSTGLTNYETARYQVVLTLAPSAEWILSVSESSRPSIGNLVSSSGENMYYEARLNNRITVNGVATTIQNTSPQYQDQDIPIPFVCYQQQTTLTFSATEPDGDSLVYSLDRPMSACNDPIPYAAIPGGGIRVISTNPPCVAIAQTGGATTYSPTYPIPSATETGTCPVKTDVPTFTFNASQGSMTFTPTVLAPAGGTNTDNYLNKYAVVGKVTEYRRIGGRMYVVGSVRRDMLVVVIDCSGNQTPGAPVATAPPITGAETINRTDSTYIRAYACNYTQVRIRFTDPNPTDLLTVTYPRDASQTAEVDQALLPSDVARLRIVGNGTRTPYGILHIQPDVLFVGQTFRIPIRIEDNSCPVKAVQNRIIVLRIDDKNFAKITTAASSSNVCAGAPVTLTAAPARPDTVQQVPGFQLKPATYTYSWAAANGLATADLNKQVVIVRPTQTTRYKLNVVATDFRLTPAPTCVDTASFLVRVAPALTANFTYSFRSGINANVPPRFYTFANTSVSRATADSVRWTYQRVKDADGNVVTGEPVVVFSRAFAPPADVLVFREGGTYEVKLRISNYTGTGAARTECTPSEKVATIVVPKLEIPNVFTPNGDGKNDTFVLTAAESGDKVQIFNRWGRLIKEYTNYQNDWDGKEQPAGVYYYMLTDRTGKTTKGWVELAR